jgi:hypothetical protein
MVDAPVLASTVTTSAVVLVAIAALVLPVYQLSRDGFLPRLRRRRP